MVNTAELRGIIAKRGLSQRKVAKALGISEKTFYDKMKKRRFGSDEIEAMVKILQIDEPWPLFFCTSCNSLGDK